MHKFVDQIQMNMQPFDLEIGEANYAVFPEGNDTYVIYKQGKEYLHIQKDGGAWIKFDGQTGLPQFDEDEEINRLGNLIDNYKEEPEDEEED